MKQKDLFVALSFAVFAVGLGLVIKQTAVVIPNMKNPAAAMENITPAAGEENHSEPVKGSGNTVPAPVPAVSETSHAAAPVSAHSDKINISEAMKLRSIGSENAPVVIEDFSALACPHCAAFHIRVLPMLKEEYIDSGKVRIVFNPFPINEASMFGVKLLQCIPADKFERMSELLYTNQTSWARSRDPKTELFNLVRITGISEDFYRDCLENKEIESFIGDSINHGVKDYGITGTPTFVFNNGKDYIRGEASLKPFKDKIDAILNGPAPKK